MEYSIALLSFIDELMSLQHYDGRWISDDGVDSVCDASVVVSWFYCILLPSLLRRKDVQGSEREFIEKLLREFFE